jgi:acyl-CoA thioesterase-1
VRILVSILLLLAVTIMPPVVATTTPTLLVVGDSLAAGYGIDPAHGWVALLARRLADDGHPHTVVNASISGDTTAGGLRRLPDLLATHRPEIVLIELGGNDGLRGVPLATFRTNLEALVRSAQDTAQTVVLVGVRMPPNYGPRYAEGFAAVYREVAESSGAVLVPALLAGVGDHLEMMQADGIHPRVEAQPLIVDNVWEVLVPLLQAGD